MGKGQQGNMPFSRFLELLLASGNYEGCMERLVSAFNPVAAGVMCRYTLSGQLGRHALRL